MVQHASILIFVLIGITAGLIAGFFGLGGGLIIVPALVYFAGFSQHAATGTSLAILLPPVGLGAVLEYYRKGHVDIRAAAVIALCLFVSAWVASRLAGKTNPLHLRLAFGIFIILVGIYITAASAAKIHK
ncbi:MAG TPA: sulfite exporter TauE/SafE family protein [bacterium]